ncbi:MAG: S1 RNA-binding domain-containing protein [bacterium]|nr:S1 RNA-binding domain-containing protein [bacterium]
MTQTDQSQNNGVPPLAEKGHHPMELLLKEMQGPGLAAKAGDLIEGKVMIKRGSRLFVDLGGRGTGIIYGKEFYEAQSIIKELKPGNSITAKIVDLDNDEGYMELSLREAGREKDWQEMKRLMDTSEEIVLKIADANRGGLIIEYKGISGFLPASQLSSEHYPRVEGGDKKKIFDELKKLVGTELNLKIMDINPEEEKLIFSEKSKTKIKTKEALAKYKTGDTVEGEITGIVNFGAFVKFDEDLEGLVHISEIDWQLIENPSDILKVGEKVKAKIIDIAGDKVSLSLKALKEDPWLKVPEHYKKGDTVTGRAVKYNPFGIFVKLDNEIQGLAHISEFGTETKMKEKIQLQNDYQFKILSVDAKEHRLALGLPERHSEKEVDLTKPAKEKTETTTPKESEPAK